MCSVKIAFWSAFLRNNFCLLDKTQRNTWNQLKIKPRYEAEFEQWIIRKSCSRLHENTKIQVLAIQTNIKKTSKIMPRARPYKNKFVLACIWKVTNFIE